MTQTIKLGTILRTMVCMSQEPMQWMAKTALQGNGKWLRELAQDFQKDTTQNNLLDPGHGGKDRGAYYYGIAEKELNLQVYRKLRKRLEGLGYTVLTSRDNDIDVDFITERSRMVNKTNADFSLAFISMQKGMIQP